MKMIKNDGCMNNVYTKCRSLILSHKVFLKSRKKRKRKTETGGVYLSHMQTITILIITT